MAVTDGSPDPHGLTPLVPTDLGTLKVTTPKKRNSFHWKAIAKAAEKLAADRLTQLDATRLEVLTWQTTNTLNYRLFKAAVGVALAGWLVVLWLVVGR